MDVDLENFKPVRLEDKPVFDDFTSKHNPLSCEYNFSNLFAWGEIYDIQWQVVNNSLVVYNGLDDEILMPIGDSCTPDELLALSDSFIEAGKSGNLTLIPEQFVEGSPELKKHFDTDLSENLGEYVYLTEKLASLSGKKLSKKRNLISQFKRNNPNYSVRKINSPELLNECFKLAEKWCIDKTCKKLSVTHETSALKRSISYFDPLQLDGLAAFSEDQLNAFAIFSRQNKDTYTVHYEKADMNTKGAPQYIVNETAKYLSGKCTYINREQDLGLPGLRKSKRSYAPELILNKYNLIRKGQPSS